MNFATFDLNLLRIFDALMDERSVTRAGERVGLSQPAISSALNRLRHSLGDPLFIRIGNEMVPTARAETICEDVRSALKEIERVLAEDALFDPARASRVFTLRGADFFSMWLMPDLFEEIAREAPHVRIRFLDSGRGEMAGLLQDGSVDIVLDRPLEAPAWISSQLLFRAPFVVIASCDHPQIVNRGVPPGAPFPLELFLSLGHAIRSVDGSMTGATDAALARLGHERNVVLALPHFRAVGLAVAKGRLIAVVPRQFAEAVAREMRLSIYAPPVEMTVPDIRMYWHSRFDKSPSHRWLRLRISECLKKQRWYGCECERREAVPA